MDIRFTHQPPSPEVQNPGNDSENASAVRGRRENGGSGNAGAIKNRLTESKDSVTRLFRKLRPVGGKMEPLGETRKSQRATAQAFE